MQDAVSAAAALLPGVRLELAERLRRTERSEVLRVRAAGAGWPGPETLIVKVFPGAGEGWARESAALAAAPAGAPVPGLVAAGADPPIVVMTDAGTGPSLADELLDGDAAAGSPGGCGRNWPGAGVRCRSNSPPRSACETIRSCRMSSLRRRFCMTLR